MVLGLMMERVSSVIVIKEDTCALRYSMSVALIMGVACLGFKGVTDFTIC